MSDIPCAKCGEPWDAYGVKNGDMDATEAQRFNKGEGCPCCQFGTACPTCDGSGKHYISKPNCPQYHSGAPLLLAWQPVLTAAKARMARKYGPGDWYVGYDPKVTPYQHADVHITRTFPTINTLDGPVRQAFIRCSCWEQAPPCTACDGTGALPPPDEDLVLEAAQAACDASDEDPIDILQQRGLI